MQDYILLEHDLGVAPDLLYSVEEDDLHRLQTKLDIINRELRDVRDLLLKHAVSRSSSCQLSCSDDLTDNEVSCRRSHVVSVTESLT